jgi:hypothetical protein
MLLTASDDPRRVERSRSATATRLGAARGHLVALHPDPAGADALLWVYRPVRRSSPHACGRKPLKNPGVAGAAIGFKSPSSHFDLRAVSGACRGLSLSRRARGTNCDRPIFRAGGSTPARRRGRTALDQDAAQRGMRRAAAASTSCRVSALDLQPSPANRLGRDTSACRSAAPRTWSASRAPFSRSRRRVSGGRACRPSTDRTSRAGTVTT